MKYKPNNAKAAIETIKYELNRHFWNLGQNGKFYGKVNLMVNVWYDKFTIRAFSHDKQT